MKPTNMIKSAKLAKPLVKGARQLAKGVAKNGNWIFALTGLIGVAGATWQMIDATIKAVKICEEKEVHGGKEVIKTVWKLYIPGAGFVLMTTLSILGQSRLNRVLSKKLIAATGLYAASQADLNAFKDKAREMFGETKSEQLQKEVQQEHVEKLPEPLDIYETGHGDQLFQLALTGGYFRANPDWIELQIADMNREADNSPDSTVYLHYLLDLFNQPPCELGNLFWDKVDMLQHGEKKIRADISTSKWVTYKGKREIACIVEILPWPTGF